MRHSFTCEYFSNFLFLTTLTSHQVYQSTFSPSTQWTENYARGGEIKNYWKHLATKYDVWKYIQFNSEVTKGMWSASKAKWTVEIRQTNTITGEVVVFHDEADFLITATGRFSQPRLPDIPEIESFEGHLRHSSQWDPNFEIAGKKVALIGNGASGLQVLPELQKLASQVDHYARNPTWVASSFGGEDLSRDIPISEGVKSKLASSPEEYLKYRKSAENKSWGGFTRVIKSSAASQKGRENMEKLMLQRLDTREDLLALAKPDFSPGCRRLTPGPGYLEALTKDNVSYIRTPIQSFTTAGIRTTDGIERHVDAVICATGAEVSCTTAFPLFNGNGIDLQASWTPGGTPGYPDTYLGMAAPDFPNLFFIVGPQGGSGFAGTVPNTVENQVTYIAKILRKVSTQGIRTIVPSRAAVDDFRAYAESFWPETVLSEDCSSWYNGGVSGGRVAALWPGSGSHVNHARREVRWEDFEYTYHNKQGNRFAYLGNGRTVNDVRASQSEDMEKDGIDFTPYLKVEAASDQGVDLRGYHEAWWEV
jgi:cation diffusion facilitator CzcD-associated flavoprotein CzcO